MESPCRARFGDSERPESMSKPPNINDLSPAPTSQLTPYEFHELQTFEEAIERGLKHFAAVGYALREIRDKRLYRAAYTNFEDYIEARWQMHVSQAKQFIVAAEVEEEVTLKTATNGSQNPAAESETPIPNERVARALASAAPKGERAGVWQEAVKTAPVVHGKKKVTAAHVKETASKARTQERQSGKMLDKVGRAITHDHVAVAFNASGDFSSLMHELSALKGRFKSLMEGPAGHYATRHRQEWDAGISNLHSIVRFSAPYAVCPYCGGERNCDSCKRSGWMPEEIYKAVPRDIRGEQ